MLELLNDFDSILASFPKNAHDYIKSALSRFLTVQALKESIVACLSDSGGKVAIEKARIVLEKIRHLTDS